MPGPRTLLVIGLCLALGCGADVRGADRDGAGPGSNPGGTGGSGASGTGAASGAGGGFDNADASSPFQTPDVDASAPRVCADLETTPERLPPTVTFLIDGSGSMSCRYPEDPSCDC